MKHGLVGLVSAAALGIGLAEMAMAADMPVKAPIYMPPVVVHNWSGLYLGGNVGGGWGHTSFGFIPSSAVSAGVQSDLVRSFGSPAVDLGGFTGGGGGGYNLQVGKFVGGVEADIEYIGLRGSHTAQINTSPCNCVIIPYDWAQSAQSNRLETLRLRSGWAFGSVLLYATGGWAMTDHTTTANLTFPTLGPGFSSTGSTSTPAGWVLGGGVEYAVAQNWSAKLEYLHLDFASGSTVFPLFASGVPIGNYNESFRADIVRLGLNYKFW